MSRGLYANIHAKRKRIANGSGETMRKAGSKGSPSAKDFKESKKTAKKTVRKAKKTARKAKRGAKKATRQAKRTARRSTRR
jgi:hypothetical protein